MKKQKKKEWLWFLLSEWLLKDGKKVRDNAIKTWLKKKKIFKTIKLNHNK